ncbi:uncharacterized protein F4807DRAFT_242584 [Annulohypoxylon truncatum]|uniref:uncharacterized protein n=1 Tax=Annulohypoxylon truncatum TaxID=327061 RepID=UPI002007E5A4|nr:uncharacterized protein F4807DRAFT_242584 [Annulohypoxylon truncatum]KAI1206018.1 hypothetical protein F4807DRAFT_242584 [Annulohypoxylon truncatum]
MYRSALRSTPRVANPLRHTTLSTGGRRFASTTPPASKKRSWKSAAVRWGLAAGAVYWYSTSAVFAEEPLPKTIPPPPQFSDEDLPTVEAVVAQKRRQAEERLRKAPSTPEPATASLSSETSSSAPVKDVETDAQAPPPEGSPEALEEEAGQQGAFNPETGEINWDCPCLGGMAQGPCGEEFKAAFSCFVYSKEEPKGMDCIDKFQHMQDCFRLHPEVYGEELDEDETSAEDAPEASTETAVAKTTTPEGGNAASKPEQTTAASKESKKIDKEVEAVAKETEKQNIPPAQP